VSGDILEAQFRQKHLLHGSVEALVNAVAFGVLFRAYDDVASWWRVELTAVTLQVSVQITVAICKYIHVNENDNVGTVCRNQH
jgi:hypothetical protein